MLKKKLIIVGIDGGSFSVINPLFEKGLLSNLKKFKNSGILNSTIPPGTAVSWASFSTGNSPGKTGIFDFTIVNDDSWKINFVNRRKLKGKTLWEYLDEAGLKTCFMNIPLTYPPDKINGVMISGIDTPSTLSEYVHPKELKEELKKIDYEIEVSALKEKDEIVKQAMGVLEKRIIIARQLLKKDFDFFIVLFRESDVVQHYAWNRNEVEEIYKKIDEFLGEIIKYSENNNADIIVMSDHGEQKVDKAFNVNVWLEENGYLKTNLKRKSLLSGLGINRERIFKILEKLKLNFLVHMVPRSFAKKIPTKEVDFEEAILTGVIDFNETRAIAKRAVKTAQIFLNNTKRKGIVKEDEEENIKQEIKKKLVNYFEKQNIKVEISTKQELYGKDSASAPDISLYFAENGYDVLTHFSSNKKLWDIPREQATHDKEGIIFSDLNLNLEHPRIIDLTPTILKYFNIKKTGFDGKSII